MGPPHVLQPQEMLMCYHPPPPHPPACTYLSSSLLVVQEKEQAGRADEDLAAEAWSNYRARNNSVIVDHFQVCVWGVGCGVWGGNSMTVDHFQVCVCARACVCVRARERACL